MIDSVFNMGAMGIAMGGTASSELLPPMESNFRPTRNYPERSNPFMKQW